MTTQFYGYEIKKVGKRYQVTDTRGNTWVSTFKTIKGAERAIRDEEGEFDRITFPL